MRQDSLLLSLPAFVINPWESGTALSSSKSRQEDDGANEEEQESVATNGQGQEQLSAIVVALIIVIIIGQCGCGRGVEVVTEGPANQAAGLRATDTGVASMGHGRVR